MLQAQIFHLVPPMPSSLPLLSDDGCARCLVPGAQIQSVNQGAWGCCPSTLSTAVPPLLSGQNNVTPCPEVCSTDDSSRELVVSVFPSLLCNLRRNVIAFGRDWLSEEVAGSSDAVNNGKPLLRREEGTTSCLEACS